MDIQEVNLRRSDFEAMHPIAKLFNFDHEKLTYFGDAYDDAKRLNDLWSTWCACVSLLYLETNTTKAQAVPEWISVNNRLPECMHECTASGLEISDTVLVSNSKDNPSIGFGHLREDGNWVVYEGEHDFMNPQKVTHWMLMLKGASQ